MVVPARPHGPCAQPGLLGQRHGLPATNRSRWPSTTGPNPGCLPAPAGPGNTRWSAAPTGPRPTGPTAKPSAWSSSSATVTGSLAQRRQRRRRITPNTNTTTTTTISTHNHVDMEASLVGAGQFTVTLLPPTRANNSVTARRPPGPGSTAALRASSRDPAPRDLPPIWAGPAGASPARQPTTRRPRRGRAAFALLGWGNNPSMAVPMRNGRRRAAGAGPGGPSGRIRQEVAFRGAPAWSSGQSRILRPPRPDSSPARPAARTALSRS
jgi:hypothetical protein